jgi:uncharacterized protein (TIGR02594 family)
LSKVNLVCTQRWLFWALLESHVVETPGTASTPRILEYFKLGDIPLAPNDATAWCAIFANAALEAEGYPGSKSAMARSFESSKNFVKLSGPARGAIVSFFRNGKSSGQGHVGFYIGENQEGTHVLICGGNQSDRVSLAWFPKVTGTSWGITGYYWPKSEELPMIGRRVVKGSPATKAERVT